MLSRARYLNPKTQLRKNCQMTVSDFKTEIKDKNPQLLGSMRWTMDTSKSIGTTFVDAEGKEYLDAFMQISSIPLGYNNQELKDAISQDDVLSYIVSRPAMGAFPPKNLPNLIEAPLEVAPKGMKYFQTLMCGSCTVENAMKSAMGYYASKKRGDVPHTLLDHTSCMEGLPPGSPDHTVLSFRGCFHGRTFGSLSLTNSKSAIKLDMPSFKWPKAPFPQLKYPLNEHERENAEEETRCLEAVKQLLYEQKMINRPVVAVIAEPIQAEGGDRHASADFFNKLIDITHENEAVFIADEVQTGFGATGRWWANDYWDNEADIVCYAKKAQACGYYYNEKFASNPNTRIFNTWMGEPLKLVMMNKIIDIVKRDNLLQNALTIGDQLMDGFKDLEKETDSFVNSVRGQGLFSAFDLDTGVNRDAVVQKAFANGLLIGPSGDKSIRFRPSLIFTEKEAEKTLDILRKVVKEF